MFEDLCLEMLLHIAPLSQVYVCTHSLGIFVFVGLEKLKVKLTACDERPRM